ATRRARLGGVRMGCCDAIAGYRKRYADPATSSVGLPTVLGPSAVDPAGPNRAHCCFQPLDRAAEHGRAAPAAPGATRPAPADLTSPNPTDSGRALRPAFSEGR